MKLIFILCFSILCFPQKTVIFGKLVKGAEVDSIQDWKIDASTILAAGFSPKFSYYNFAEQLDYIEKNSSKTFDSATVDIAWDFGIDYYAIYRIDKIKNMLGVNLRLKSRLDTVQDKLGMGFANLNLKNVSDNSPIFDIAITNAIQRAYADAFNDSLMYDTVSVDDYRVYPQKTLVIGGLEFIQSEKIKSWQLFDEKVVNSYDFAENMWEEAKNAGTHIVYDIETRDTIYTKYNMYGIENYDGPTKFEIQALNDFAVDQFLTGKFVRKDNEVEISIYLCDIQKESLDIIVEKSAFLEEDSIVKAREIIRELVKEILASE